MQGSARQDPEPERQQRARQRRIAAGKPQASRYPERLTCARPDPERLTTPGRRRSVENFVDSVRSV